jgi:beta-glucanase (GH16 family)
MRIVILAVMVMGVAGALFFMRRDSEDAAAKNDNFSFVDEFDGDHVDTTTWAVLSRGPDVSNNEKQCYLPDNVSLDDGSLLITSKRDRNGCSAANDSSLYSSGMLQWRSMTFTYGHIDVRARLAGGKGTWPAIWLLGYKCQASNLVDAEAADCDWPNPGADEIDIAEVLNGQSEQVNQQIHTASSNEGCHPSINDPDDTWHVYSIDWQPKSLTFMVDGKTTCKLTKNIPSTPMFLIINTALGGNGGGDIDNSSLPASMHIDYVHVSSSAGS